jgi:hypothetical protein
VATTNLNDLGISGAVRSMLETSPNQDFTAAQMRDAMSERGFDWKDIGNPLPAVHTVLGRLVKNGTAVTSNNAEGTKVFRLAPPKLPAVQVPAMQVPGFDPEVLRTINDAIQKATTSVNALKVSSPRRR